MPRITIAKDSNSTTVKTIIVLKKKKQAPTTDADDVEATLKLEFITRQDGRGKEGKWSSILIYD